MAYPTAYKSSVAIPLPPEKTVQQIMGKSYDPVRTLNVLKMFAGTDDLYEATIDLVHAMFQAKGIDPRTREMIILRAAKVLNAPYESQANVVMAKNAGLSATEIDAAATDGTVSGINPEYVLVCKAQDDHLACPGINTFRLEHCVHYTDRRLVQVLRSGEHLQDVQGPLRIIGFAHNLLDGLLGRQ